MPLLEALPPCPPHGDEASLGLMAVEDGDVGPATSFMRCSLSGQCIM